MCVLKIDEKVAELVGARKISNISYYHDVEFKDEGALYKEYFEVGNGKFFKYNGLFNIITYSVLELMESFFQQIQNLSMEPLFLWTGFLQKDKMNP